MTDKGRLLLIEVRGMPQAEHDGDFRGDFLCGGCRFAQWANRSQCLLFQIVRAANTQGDYIRCKQCMDAEVAGAEYGRAEVEQGQVAEGGIDLRRTIADLRSAVTMLEAAQRHMTTCCVDEQPGKGGQS